MAVPISPISDRYATPWTASACCYNGVPLAQADLSAPYASLAVDKAPGVKTWAVTTMVQEWLASPASNFTLLLNSDATVARDHYRYFASTKYADATLQPTLQITYALPDTTPPLISAVASAPSTRAAAISWSTNEMADSRVDYGSTTAYGSVAGVNASLVTSHLMQLSGLSDGAAYHYRVRSRDAAANLAVSGDFTFTTPDTTAPSASISSPAAGTTVGGLVTVGAQASDSVGVVGVQFQVDGVNLGAEDTANPYAVAWNSTTAPNGAHTVSAVARDAAGNTANAATVTVSVTNADVTPPAVSMTAPANGATVSGTAVTVSASATDNVGVAGVQFMLDGANLSAEDTASPYTISWDTTTTANGAHSLTAVARDAAGNASTTSTALTVTVSNASPPTSSTIWSASATPKQIQTSDRSAVELGVRFRTDVNGSITGIRFYKGTGNTGTHVGSLWTNTGTLLAAATFSNETASGWQQMVFGSPVVVTANTTYVASYHTNVGQYAADRSYFATAGVDNAPLHGLANGVGGGNGAYVYGASAFPRQTYQSSNYWVDVVFVANGGGDTTAPTVAVKAPANGATVSGASVTLSATATDNVGVVGVQFKVDGASLGAEDTASPYTTTWNTTSATAGSHSLTAVARDAAGNSRTSAVVTVTVANDVTPPIVSGVAATAITAAAATIVWTTNEGSSSQVDYGLTTAYGTSSVLNATLVTSHSVSLGSLAASTTHHARVRSRDAAGNPAISGDFTFATGAITPPPSGWPHEPAGFAARASSSLDAFSGNGWDIVNPNGSATVVADAGGSLTPAKVGQWKYPSGFGGGTAPATMYHALPPAFDEGFVGVMWKPSNPWQGHSTFVNKIFFLLGGACGNLIPIMYGPPGGPYQLRVAPEWGNWSWLTPNVNDVPIALGSWHRIELYFKYNTAGSGIVRWWMDGTLMGDYTNVTFPGSGCLAEFQFSPTWGGVGDVKTETDYFWFDDAYISVPSGAPSMPPGTVLFQEGFEDASLASRDWYDNTTVQLSTTEHVANSRSSLQYTFAQAATSPTAGSALRRTFAPTDSVYLGYWVKYSSNWVGSQQPYHPHEFHFLTTLDDSWSGLSFGHLTTYIEQNGGTPLLGIQDGVNVDQTRIGVNLTAVTESRGVAGCNGSSDGYADNCYLAGGAYVNEKKWRAAARFFTDTPGAFYKSNWHFVEAFVKMNSIVGGKGANDGVVQYWFDGQLIIDHHDVLPRTGANAAMQFNQLVIAPYIGDGSPVTQSLWIDNLTVATRRLP